MTVGGSGWSLRHYTNDCVLPHPRPSLIDNSSRREHCTACVGEGAGGLGIPGHSQHYPLRNLGGQTSEVFDYSLSTYATLKTSEVLV